MIRQRQGKQGNAGMTTVRQNRKYTEYQSYPEEQMCQRARNFYREIQKRRTVRDFSSREVPASVIEDAIRAAGTAPNGANRQPWHFVVIKDPAIKRRIRVAAEKEETLFYHQRATEAWLNDLAPLGTTPHKPFLEEAPCLMAIFAEKYGMDSEGVKHKNYYVPESVGIATGFMIAALHHAGLASLTHTPSPMGFLNEILDRPVNEKPFLLLVIGYPEEGAEVPDITKKPLTDIASFK